MERHLSQMRDIISQYRPSKHFLASLSTSSDLLEGDRGTAAALEHTRAMILASTQSFLEINFGSRVESITSESQRKKIALYSVGNLQYAVVSTLETIGGVVEDGEEEEDVSDEQVVRLWRQYKQQGMETVSALRKQLKLFHGLLRFCVQELGPNVNPYSARIPNDIASRIKPLLSTMEAMFQSHQSVLVQAVEVLDCGKINRSMIADAIESACKARGKYGSMTIHHAVLLVRTKCVAIHSHKNTFTLMPSDILNLIIYAQNAFHVDPTVDGGVYEEHLVKDEQNAQPLRSGKLPKSMNSVNTAEDNSTYTLGTVITDHFASGSTTQSVESDRDVLDDISADGEEFLDSQEPLQSDDKPKSLSENETFELAGEVNSFTSENEEYERTETESEYFESNASSNRMYKFDHVVLHTTPLEHADKLHKFALYSEYDPEHNTTLLLVCDPIATPRTPASPFAMRPQKRAGNINDDTYDDEKEEDTEEDILQRQCMDVVNRIQDKLKSFNSFLQIKEQTHMTMKHYLHHCPGLVHFILVDRARGIMLAPRIVQLGNDNETSIPSETLPSSSSTSTIDANAESSRRATAEDSENPDTDPHAEDTKSDHSENTSLGDGDSNTAETLHSSIELDLQVEFLRDKIWQMVHLIQGYQDEGYTEVSVCDDTIQYSYQEWAEDENGTQIKIIPQNLRHIRAHYELYTMYLPFVSTAAVAASNRSLVSLLLDQINKD